MTARVIDGTAVAAALRTQLTARVALLGYRPGLAVVLVGEDPASVRYVRNKDKAAATAGIDARTIRMPASTDQPALLRQIESLNQDPSVDGILVQLPLPPQIDATAIVEAVDPAKDVDGFHPMNVGRLAAGRVYPGSSHGGPGRTMIGRLPLVPCTPLGVMRLLTAAGVTIAGARALVLGRSAIVGRPMAALLLAADATVTVAHSRTKNLPEECRRAEIVVSALGQPEMVRGNWIRPGAAIIDVGVNRRPDGELVGDVAFDECAEIAGAITPVPGGVGPMTIACLLENTIDAAERRRGSDFIA